MSHHRAFNSLVIFVILCAGVSAQDDRHDNGPSHEPAPVSLEGWPSETFALPPGFAPELPSGSESLRFAPGWRDPSTQEFWSYAFVMSIDEPAPGAARIDEILEGYYTGLMRVFASNRDKDISDTPVRVDVARTAQNQFEAQMHLIDAFATFQPIDILVLVETIADTDEHSFVCVRVSRQHKGHEIWRSLAAAIERIRFTDDTLPVERETEASVSIDVLKERAAYAALDKRGVGALARAAEAHWADVFAGFAFDRVEHFSAGGVSHWMSIWTHGKTDLEFVLVPGGKFQMGSPAHEANRDENELQHWVVLDPFLIARTECTQGAWARVAEVAGLNSDPSHFDGSDRLPVERVRFEDVRKWCRGAHLTLPTEAQWEYVCRAGTTTPWTMGGDKTDLARFANLGSAECPEDWIEHEMGITEPWHDGYGNQLAEAGSFEPNAFGLFDVHGNVRELCRDDFIGYEVQVDKGTGLRPGTSGMRLARGGSFNNTASVARSAKRLKNLAQAHRMVGFRPSLDLHF